MSEEERMISYQIGVIRRNFINLSDDDIVDKIRGSFEDFGMELSPELEAYARTILGSYESDSLSLQGLSTIPLGPSWILSDTLNNIKPNHWNVYKRNVKKYLHLSDDEIEELERVNLHIINYLIPPNASYDSGHKSQYRKKGLVYGNVQSGKTASMGAVISQYVTLGCNLVIVLSGVHNNLREQTQERLKRDLGIDVQENHNLHWRLITGADDNLADGDGHLWSDVDDKTRIIGVFKKNSTILSNFLKYYLQIDNANLDRSFLAKVNALIIDDECDQASINVASPNDENERTKINECITDMFRFFPRYAYVGYTATPFANVLSEGPGEFSMYPSDFITMLPEKKDYFGATKIFGLGEEFETYEEKGKKTLNIIRKTCPGKKNGIDEKAIKDATEYFILATAVKRIRARLLGDNYLLNSHSTMMIHTSGRIDDHKTVYEGVKSYLASLRDGWNTEKSRTDFRRVWEAVYLNSRNENLEAIADLFTTSVEDLTVPSDFNVIYDEAKKVLDRVEIRIDNSQSGLENRLRYDNDHADYFIAVGGNTLSRGLTLQGLVVAVFARKAKTYDTLLQMGRWFGYRKRYEDLVRLWLTDEAEKNMRFLAGVEIDLRDAINQYSGDGITPQTLAVAIRTRPHMQIVRKLAMQGAVKASINYVGRHPQTISFRNDEQWLQNNIDVTKKLIRRNMDKYVGHINGEGYLFKDINPVSLSEYISSYNFDSNTNGLSSELLTAFKKKAEEEGYITTWNMVVKSNINGQHSDTGLIPGHIVNLLERGKMEGEKDRLYLKAVSSSWDIVCDIEGGPDVVKSDDDKKKYDNNGKFRYRNEYYSRQNKKTPGLLVVYPIYGKSRATSKGRVSLDAVRDVYGISLIFPKPEKNIGKLFESVAIELRDVKEIEKEEYTDD